ncbi:class I SAM-dependent methyltransferase [Nocardia sp. NEAU-G5]|uniref:Class I SAM-dependent methyltransferase n=2 Tax=Nocardia albiluteola TaxID=2842303 RepID=A0ABS6AW59_9NOCA|nr:class I SAM-dependent methyltransferase [Nocardia albiluteola]
MTESHTLAHYETGSSRPDIERALVAAGKDLGQLRMADLAMLEDFHTGGRIATGQLADLLDIGPDSTVLDAGSGIGGTARFIAERFGCRVSAIDLTDSYCDTARWLNGLVGLDDRITVREGDVTELPFADSSFDFVFSQHVQMNVADKGLLYREARRVSRGDGRLAIWDIFAGQGGEPAFPQPWADQPRDSYLETPAAVRATIEASGFAVDHWVDLTEQAVSTMRMVQALPPNPLGLHAFVPDFGTRIENLINALADGRVRAVRAIARAV